MSSQLLPCPFCGGDAELTSRIVNSGQTLYRYRCASCHAAIGRWHGGISGHDYTAAETWNTRAERTCRNIDEYAENGFFICGNCGFGKDAIELTPRYCPDCGARVVE